MVAPACKSNCFRGGDGRIMVWGQPGQKLARPYFKEQDRHGSLGLQYQLHVGQK
jgi:hypothetical protein